MMLGTADTSSSINNDLLSDIEDLQSYEPVVKKKRGPYKKNDQSTLSTHRARTKQEKQYITTLNKKMLEMGKRTKTHGAYFVYHQGRLVANGSSTAMDKFVADPVVQELFIKYAVSSDACDFPSDHILNEQCETVREEIDEEGDFVFPADWENLNIHKKRQLVCDMVSWTNTGKTKKWTLSNRPDWWPQDIKYGSPNTEQTRHKIFELDKIIKGFLHCQSQQMLKEITDDIDEIITEFVKLDTEKEVTSFAHSMYEKLLAVGEIDFPKETLTINKLDISFNHLLDGQSLNSVMWGNDVVSECLWHTRKYGAIIKFIGIIYCLTHVEDTMKFLQEHEFGDMFLSSNQDMVELNVSPILGIKEALSHSNSILHLFGIAHILKMNISMVGDNSRQEYKNFPERTDVTVRYCQENIISFAATVSFEFDLINPCTYNDVCNISQNEDGPLVNHSVIKCPSCCLLYHQKCVGSDKSICGCSDVKGHLLKLQILTNEKRLSKIFSHWEEPLKKKADLLAMKYDNFRKFRIRQLLQNNCSFPRRYLLLTRDFDKLKVMNSFYNIKQPKKCNQLLEGFIKDCLEDLNSESLYDSFRDIEPDIIMKEILIPEVGNLILRRTIDKCGLNMIVAQRVVSLATEIGYL